MTCSENLCCGGCSQALVYDRSFSNDDFLETIQHEKCKLIQLVRSQMHKIIEVKPVKDEISATLSLTRWASNPEVQDAFTENLDYTESKDANTLAPEPELQVHEPAMIQAVQPEISQPSSAGNWTVRNMKRMLSQLHVIGGIVGVGAIAFVSLMYGAHLGATMCNNAGFPITSFEYSYTEQLLF